MHQFIHRTLFHHRSAAEYFLLPSPFSCHFSTIFRRELNNCSLSQLIGSQGHSWFNTPSKLTSPCLALNPSHIWLRLMIFVSFVTVALSSSWICQYSSFVLAIQKNHIRGHHFYEKLNAVVSVLRSGACKVAQSSGGSGYELLLLHWWNGNPPSAGKYTEDPGGCLHLSLPVFSIRSDNTLVEKFPRFFRFLSSF